MEIPLKFRYKCHSLVTYAQKLGILTKPESCEKCGVSQDKLLAHHDDYMQPLKIRWLCPTCHRRLHAVKLTEEISERTDLPSAPIPGYVSALEFSRLMNLHYVTVIHRLRKGTLKGVIAMLGAKKVWQINPNDYLPTKEEECSQQDKQPKRRAYR